MIRPLEEKAAFLNALPFVSWDRCTVWNDGRNMSVYGWIARDDGRSDFVTIEFDGQGVGFTTSSAKRSREIHERLFGEVVDHNDCERVEDVFGDLVSESIAA